jgi:hypothetical protein
MGISDHAPSRVQPSPAPNTEQDSEALLIDDAENIECRVNGSTLVLKTCYLKKA